MVPTELSGVNRSLFILDKYSVVMERQFKDVGKPKVITTLAYVYFHWYTTDNYEFLYCLIA